MRPERILVLNVGSSSLRVAAFERQSRRAVLTALAERVGTEAGLLRIERPGAEPTPVEHFAARDHGEAFVVVLERFEREGVAQASVVAVGHRVVHGGERYAEAVLVDDEVLEEIGRAAALAPLHNPYHLIGIEAARRAFPRVPQVAVFDTSFHATLPPVAHLYAIPYHLYHRRRIRRYGFHGTSHAYVRHHLPKVLGRPLPARVVSLHLGNGASSCAILKGRSVDTSMGLTPLEGLVMGTRSGDVDPAVVEQIVAREDMTVGEAIALLNQQSGLLGVSGLSGDVRDLLAAEARGEARAGLALDLYCYRIRKGIGAMAAALGGLDAIAFTAGVGENAPAIRVRALTGLEFLGVEIDRAANQRLAGGAEGTFQRRTGRVALAVVHTDEAWVIASETARVAGLLGRGRPARVRRRKAP